MTDAIDAYNRAYDKAMEKCKARARELLVQLAADESSLDDFYGRGVQGYAFKYDRKLIAVYFTGNAERKGGPRLQTGRLRIHLGKPLLEPLPEGVIP